MCVYTVIYKYKLIYIYYQHKHAKMFKQSLRVRSKETWLNQWNYSFICCFLFLLFVARLRMAILASIQSSKSSETHKPHQPKATGNVGWVTQKFLFSLSLSISSGNNITFSVRRVISLLSIYYWQHSCRMQVECLAAPGGYWHYWRW